MEVPMMMPVKRLFRILTRLTIVPLLVAFTPPEAAADDGSARARLVGAWQPQEPAAKENGVWTLERKDGDVLHITYSLGDEKRIDFECSTKGGECDVKDAGKPAKVSLWFSGAKLVELETKGQEVVKRRFAVTAEGDSMELEVIPISPEGKTETMHFRRMRS
jgi:hypothetical protein